MPHTHRLDRALMQYLRPDAGQLPQLFKAQRRDRLRLRDDVRVGGEDAGDVRPVFVDVRAERRGGPAEGADAGADIVVDAQLLQLVKLFTHSAVDTRIAGMETDSGLALGLGLTDDGNDLLQRHFRAVVDRTVLFCVVQQRRIDERTGVDHDVRLAEQPRTAHGDEVRCAAPGADKMYHKLCLHYLLQQSLRAAGLAQAAIFLGKNHRAGGHLAALVRKMKLDALREAGQHRVI